MATILKAIVLFILFGFLQVYSPLNLGFIAQVIVELCGIWFIAKSI